MKKKFESIYNKLYIFKFEKGLNISGIGFVKEEIFINCTFKKLYSIRINHPPWNLQSSSLSIGIGFVEEEIRNIYKLYT